MPAPANDDIANAITISGASGSTAAVVIDDATTESGELGSLDQTVWYVFRADTSATGLYVSTQGSAAGDSASGDGITPPNPFGSLDTHIIVWEASSPSPSFGSLFGHNIASNEDAPSGGGAYWSEVTFDVTAGKWYFIQVGSAFGPGYTGTVVLNWSGFPAAPGALTVEFISEASGCQYVPSAGVTNIPVTMPTGVQAGDYLVMSWGNIQVSPLDVLATPPAGWVQYNDNQFVKLADGSESGTTVNFSSQDTTTFPGDMRTFCAVTTCYRFSVPPSGIFSGSGSGGNFGALGTSASSAIGDPVDGLTTQLRVYIVTGQGQPVEFDSPADPLTDVIWTNVTARSDLITANTTNADGELDDSQGTEVGDSLYSNPGGVIDPGDAVTAVSAGPYFTGAVVHEVWFYWPQLLIVAYWGINATTPA